MCHQVASFNRCLFKVQRDRQTQLKTVRSKSKGKGPSKTSEVAEEWQFLMEFNSSISQAAAKAMEHLTDFVFITMGNLTLARHDAYLDHVKNGIKPDMLAALRIVPIHISTLFPDAFIKRAEEEIADYDSQLHCLLTTRVSSTLMRGVVRKQRVGRRLSRRDLYWETSV